MHLKVLLMVFLAVTAAAVLSVLVFRRPWRKPGKVRGAAMNMLLMGYSLGYAGLAAEYYFYEYMIAPEGFQITLASKRWFQQNYSWNRLSYRDFEQRPEDFEGKRALFVVGDSFAAGSGIANQADRFSDQLAQYLGSEWRVANVATGGWDTVREFEALKAYPHKPEVVVLSYYLNDIQHAIESHGLEYVPPFPSPPAFVRPLVDKSYFVNFVYWRIYRVKAQFVKVDYWEGLKKYYATESVWAEHAAVLSDMAAYCRENDIVLYALIFPNLMAVEESKALTEKVWGHFASLGVPALDLSPVFAGREVSGIVVSAVNAHPNEMIHHEVGALLHAFLEKQGALDAKD